MTKRHYKQGIDRQQEYLLPTSIEEYIRPDNSVRAIEVYVESLDLAELGFKNASGLLGPGQPAYRPADLLKLYLYGYLHRVRSSRRLDQETRRNLEVIWLLRGLQPGYKTIADFRKNNLQALKATQGDFIQLCKELDLFGKELVGIDSSYFRGNVSKGSIYTEERLKKDLERIEKHIAEYLQAMEAADAEEDEGHNEDEASQVDPTLQEKLAVLRDRQQSQQSRLKKLQDSVERQLSEVDEDARLLSKNGQSVAGYNVQTAVDEKHKLIVVHKVIQNGNDEQQLEPMAKAAKAELEVGHLDVAADAGYFNAQQIKNCQEAQITVYVPEPNKTNQVRLQGRFSREDFTYQAERNCYICPGGAELKLQSTITRNGKRDHQYRSRPKGCASCVLRHQCLPKKTPCRTVTRWEHEEVNEDHRERMKLTGREKMRQRASLSEHVFGTLKQWCGWTHFLLRGLEKVCAEMSLLVLAYNFRRVLTILGLEVFSDYCRKRAGNAVLNC